MYRPSLITWIYIWIIIIHMCESIMLVHILQHTRKTEKYNVVCYCVVFYYFCCVLFFPYVTSRTTEYKTLLRLFFFGFDKKFNEKIDGFYDVMFTFIIFILLVQVVQQCTIHTVCFVYFLDEYLQLLDLDVFYRRPNKKKKHVETLLCWLLHLARY